MANTMHDCPGGCGRSVPRHRVACRNCWLWLPRELRERINATWTGVPGGLAKHSQALAEAFDWYERQRELATGEPTGDSGTT